MEEPSRLLVVDDEEMNRMIYEELFDDERSYHLQIAEDGEQALEIVKTFEPELVLLDIMMPGINGYEVCKTMRANKRLAYTKIILVSGKAMLKERMEGYDAGADDYMTKPFENEELVAKAQVYLRLSRAEKGLSDFNRALEEQVKLRTEELQALAIRLEKSFADSINVLARITEMGESENPDISSRIAELARNFGQHLHFGRQDCDDLYHAGLLARVGRISLPPDLKNASLVSMTPQDHKLLTTLPLLTETMLMANDWAKVPSLFIRHHKEWINGEGYPDHLAGDAIPMGARILAIATDYEELQRGLILKEKLLSVEAIKYLEGYAGERYDADLVKAFRKMLEKSAARIYQEELKLSPLSLTKGMVVTRDLRTADGTLLIRKDTQLEQKMVDNLKRIADNSLQDFIVYVREFSAGADKSAR